MSDSACNNDTYSIYQRHNEQRKQFGNTCMYSDYICMTLLVPKKTRRTYNSVNTTLHVQRGSCIFSQSSHEKRL
jgi:hypothetical protein